MATQTSTTGQMANASRELITAARFAEEHNTPTKQLVAPFRLPAGHDTGIFPRFDRMTMRDRNEGEEIVDSEDIGMTTVSATPARVGGKVVMTDTLLRRNVAVTWRSVGRQLGNAQARKEDEDIISLFTGLNGGTTLGAAAAPLSVANAVGVIGVAKQNRMGENMRVVHHPTAILRLSRDLNVIGGGTNVALSTGFSVERLRNFWTGIRLSGVPFFETGNIAPDASDDAIGAIMDEDALGFLTEVAWNSERDRKAALSGWELVVTSYYVAFEMDDRLGAPMTYDAATPATS